jgi:hypothetical protein
MVMRTITAIIAAYTTIGLSNSAYALTQPEFTTAYQRYVSVATGEGVRPNRVCFADYCANQMSLVTKDGDMVLLSNMAELPQLSQSSLLLAQQ